MELIRTAPSVNYFINQYNKIGIPFTVKHGTYTTTIDLGEIKQKFLTHKFSNKVFAAASMIKRDVMASEKGKQIMASAYEKSNYGNSFRDEIYLPIASNIDINSAYATCLFTHNLISEKTFNYIRTLKKEERLPCVGMLAQSHTKFIYSKGKCRHMETFRAPTAQVFYFLISEINYLMRDIQFELGPDFVFYWVDGIFFRPQAPKKRIQTVENMILEQGYGFKYEDVRDFRYRREGEKYVVEMFKNSDFKRYEFTPSDVGMGIKHKLNELAREDGAIAIHA